MLARLNKMRSKWSRPLATYENVKLLSHHVPKTAGTSLRISLQSAYGHNSVYGIYEDTGALQFSLGSNIWAPSRSQVLHGHFRPHKNQSRQCPNAQRIIWLRDPVDRALSQLRHTLTRKQPISTYEYIKTQYLERGVSDTNTLFIAILADKKFKALFHIYYYYFANVEPKYFDFIGSMENYGSELKRLEKILGVKLEESVSNQAEDSIDADLDTNVRQEAQRILEQEYTYYSYAHNNRERL